MCVISKIRSPVNEYFNFSKHDMVQGNDLCDVMLDAVWQAGHAAAVHAGKSKCMHCAHFTNKFNSEMKDIMQQNGNGNRSTSSGKGTTRSHNKHPRRVSFQIIGFDIMFCLTEASIAT